MFSLMIGLVECMSCKGVPERHDCNMLNMRYLKSVRTQTIIPAEYEVLVCVPTN